MEEDDRDEGSSGGDGSSLDGRQHQATEKTEMQRDKDGTRHG